MSESVEYHPALTQERQDRINISLAEQLAEKQLREGTASSQVIVHYLKLGTLKEQLENEKLIKELEVADAKIEALAAQVHAQQSFDNLVDIIKSYQGVADEEVVG